MSSVVCSLIILNYNGKHFLERLLLSVQQQDFPKEKYEVIFVDNGSIDGSTEMIKKKFPFMRILKLPHNMGIGYGLNYGARAAKGKYLCFLGSDQAIPPNYVSTLVETIKRHEGKIVVCKVKFFNGTIQWAGGRIVRGKPITIGFGDPVDNYNFEGEVPWDWATSQAMIIRKSDFWRIGGFLEELPVAEDVEFGLRARKMGYKIVFTGKTFTFNQWRGALNTLPKSKQIFDMVYSRHRTAKLHLSKGERLSLILQDLIFAVARAVHLSFKESLAVLKGISKNLI